MERTLVKYPLFVAIMCALAFVLMAPGMALADETGGTAQDNDNQAVASQPAETEADDNGGSAQVTEPQGTETTKTTTEVTPAPDPEPQPDPASGTEPAGEDSGASAGDTDDTVDTDGTTEDANGSEEVNRGEAPAVTEQESTVEESAQQDAAADTTVKAATAAATATTATATASKAKSTTTVKKAGGAKSVKNGYYFLESAKKLWMVLGATDSDAKGVAYKNKNSMVWYLKYFSSVGAYLVVNRATKQYLSVDGAKSKSGANVITLAKPGAKNSSYWVVTKNAAGGYTFKSLLGNIILDLNGGKSVKDGVNADVRFAAKSNGKVASYQRWYLLPLKPTVAKSDDLNLDPYYQVKLANSKKDETLTVKGLSIANKANVISDKCSNILAKKWVIQSDGNGYYYLVNLNSGKALTVKDGYRIATANVQQETKIASNKAASDKQKWAIHKNSDGTYTFISKATGMALELTKDGNGANARTYFPGKRKGYQEFELQYTNILTGEGVYAITTRVNTNHVLTVPNNSMSAGSQVISDTYKRLLSQKFVIAETTDGTFKIKSAVSGMNLAMQNGKVVQAKENLNDKAQHWKIVFRGSGIALVNAETNKAISLGTSYKKTGAKAVGETLSAKAAESLLLSKRNIIDNGVYYMRLSAPTSNKVLTVTDGVSRLQDMGGGNVFKYRITNLGNDTYKIVNTSTKKAIIANANGTLDQSGTISKNAKWKASVSQYGGVFFKNVATGKGLQSAVKAGAKATAAAPHPAYKTQRWYVDPTTLLKPYQERALNKVIDRDSPTNYYFVVDTTNHRMMMFTRASKTDTWKLADDWMITVGRIENGVTRTPWGDYAIVRTQLWLLDKNRTWACKYATYWGHYAYFHSILYSYNGKRVIQGKLGTNQSSGCVRMDIPHCKWLYDNIDLIRGSSVTSWY